MNRTSLLLIAAPMLAGVLSAQSPSNLIGITRFAPSLRQVDHAACAPLGQCAIALPGPALPPPFAGGTAWDPKRSGAWVTNGFALAKFDANCAPQCPPAPIPTLGPNAVATGLEVSESLDRILIVDSQGNLHAYTNTCPPAPISVCNTGLVQAGSRVTTGLAIDEDLGLVFIAYVDAAVGMNSVVVTRLSNPCQIVCQLPVAPCFPGFGTLSGLACDWGTRTLYGTDGSSTVALGYAPATAIGCVAWTGQTCCPQPPVADPMVGLAIRPGGATSHGTPCANGTCAPCPSVHSLRNDPSLGNAAFQLGLDQAPAGSLSWCLIGAGPCAAPGVLLPPLCGPVYATPVVGTLGPNPTGGLGGPCSGSTSFAFPLPPSATFAGWTLSSQCVSLCVSGGAIGTAVSNCLSFTLQGS